MPGAVSIWIVGLGLGECKDAHADSGQDDAGRQEGKATTRRITVVCAIAHSCLNILDTH